MNKVTRLQAVSHPLRLRILFALDAQEEARTSDLAAELGVAANKVSYHLSLMEKGGIIRKRTGEDARETWWSVITENLDMKEGEGSDSLAEDSRAATLASLEYLRSLVPALEPGESEERPNQSIMVTNAYLTTEQVKELADDLAALLHRARDLSDQNREQGNGRLYAVGAQLLPARAEQG